MNGATMDHISDAIGVEVAKEAETALRHLLSTVTSAPPVFRGSGMDSAFAQVEEQITGDWSVFVKDLRTAAGHAVGKCHNFCVEVRTLAKPGSEKQFHAQDFKLNVYQGAFDQPLSQIEAAFSKAAVNLKANEALRAAHNQAELAKALTGKNSVHLPSWEHSRHDLLRECRRDVHGGLSSISSTATNGLRLLEELWDTIERAKLQNAEARLLAPRESNQDTDRIIVNVDPPIVNLPAPVVNLTLAPPQNVSSQPAGGPFRLGKDDNGKCCLSWSGGSLAVSDSIETFLKQLNDTGTATARMEHVSKLLEAVPILKQYIQAQGKRQSDGKADYAAPSLKGKIEAAQ
jgi:hypothetical protein